MFSEMMIDKKSKFISILILTLLAMWVMYCNREFKNPVDTDVHLDNVKDLAVDQEGEGIRISWSTQIQVRDGYAIERKLSEQSFVLLAKVSDPEITTYLDTTITTDILYTYRIRGFSDDNYTPYSSEVSFGVHFPVPFDLHYQTLSDSSIKIAWQDSAIFETGFIIERQFLNDSIWHIIGQTGKDEKVCTDTGIGYNVNYTYRISAVTHRNVSAYSDVLIAKIFLSPPWMDAVLPLNDHQMRIEWSDVNAFAKGFAIERMQNHNLQWDEIGRVSNTESIFISDSLRVNTTYSYRMKTFSDKYYSEYSNQEDAQTVFPAPANLQISSVGNDVSLSWDDLEFEEGYKLRYVVYGQTDTLSYNLTENTTSFTFMSLDTNSRYMVFINAYTQFNNSEETLAELIFMTRMDVLHSFPAHSDTINCLDFSNDNQVLASGGSDSDVNIWSVDSWSKITSIVETEQNENVVTLDFVRSGSYLAVGYQHSFLKLFNNLTWDFYNDINPITYRLYNMTASDLTDKMAVSKYKFIYIWSSLSWSLEKTFTASDNNVHGLMFDINGNWLAASSGTSDIKIWETTNWTEMQTLNIHTGTVRTLDVSPDGNWLASGSDDHTIIIWRTDTWTNAQTLTDHSGKIMQIKFSQDNLWLASVQESDHRILLWNISDWSLQEILKLPVDTEITSLAFSPDSHLLAAGDAGGNIWIFKIGGTWTLGNN